MAIVDILTVLTHNSGQVLATVTQGGLSGVDSMMRAVGSMAAGTTSLTVVFLSSFLKGLTS